MHPEAAVQELTPGLTRYCTVQTRDPSLAEEVAQESQVALVQCWSLRYAPDSTRHLSTQSRGDEQPERSSADVYGCPTASDRGP